MNVKEHRAIIVKLLILLVIDLGPLPTFLWYEVPVKKLKPYVTSKSASEKARFVRPAVKFARAMPQKLESIKELSALAYKPTNMDEIRQAIGDQ